MVGDWSNWIPRIEALKSETCRTGAATIRALPPSDDTWASSSRTRRSSEACWFQKRSTTTLPLAIAVRTAAGELVAFGVASGRCAALGARVGVAAVLAGVAGAAEAEVAPPPEACWMRWLTASDWPAAPRALVMALPRPPGIELPGPCAGDVEVAAVLGAAVFAGVGELLSPFGRSATM